MWALLACGDLPTWYGHQVWTWSNKASAGLESRAVLHGQEKQLCVGSSWRRRFGFLCSCVPVG